MRIPGTDHEIDLDALADLAGSIAAEAADERAAEAERYDDDYPEVDDVEYPW